MAYVPVEIWVPDTTEGPVTGVLRLKMCETCKSLIPVEVMDEHIAQAHPTLEVTPH